MVNTVPIGTLPVFQGIATPFSAATPGTFTPFQQQSAFEAIGNGIAAGSRLDDATALANSLGFFSPQGGSVQWQAAYVDHGSAAEKTSTPKLMALGVLPPTTTTSSLMEFLNAVSRGESGTFCHPGHKGIKLSFSDKTLHKKTDGEIIPAIKLTVDIPRKDVRHSESGFESVKAILTQILLTYEKAKLRKGDNLPVLEIKAAAWVKTLVMDYYRQRLKEYRDFRFQQCREITGKTNIAEARDALQHFKIPSVTYYADMVMPLFAEFENIWRGMFGVEFCGKETEETKEFRGFRHDLNNRATILRVFREDWLKSTMRGKEDDLSILLPSTSVAYAIENIQKHQRVIAEIKGINIVVEDRAPELKDRLFDSDQFEYFKRAVQELVINAIKCKGVTPKKIVIKTSVGGEGNKLLFVEVRNDGSPMSAEAHANWGKVHKGADESGKFRSHYGTANVVEFVKEMCHGDYEVISNFDVGGTIIRFAIPIESLDKRPGKSTPEKRASIGPFDEPQISARPVPVAVEILPAEKIDAAAAKIERWLGNYRGDHKEAAPILHALNVSLKALKDKRLSVELKSRMIACVIPDSGPIRFNNIYLFATLVAPIEVHKDRFFSADDAAILEEAVLQYPHKISAHKASMDLFVNTADARAQALGRTRPKRGFLRDTNEGKLIANIVGSLDRDTLDLYIEKRRNHDSVEFWGKLTPYLMILPTNLQTPAFEYALSDYPHFFPRMSAFISAYFLGRNFFEKKGKEHSGDLVDKFLIPYLLDMETPPDIDMIKWLVPFEMAKRSGRPISAKQIIEDETEQGTGVLLGAYKTEDQALMALHGDAARGRVGRFAEDRSCEYNVTASGSHYYLWKGQSTTVGGEGDPAKRSQHTHPKHPQPSKCDFMTTEVGSSVAVYAETDEKDKFTVTKRLNQNIAQYTELEYEGERLSSQKQGFLLFTADLSDNDTGYFIPQSEVESLTPFNRSKELEIPSAHPEGSDTLRVRMELRVDGDIKVVDLNNDAIIYIPAIFDSYRPLAVDGSTVMRGPMCASRPSKKKILVSKWGKLPQVAWVKPPHGPQIAKVIYEFDEDVPFHAIAANFLDGVQGGIADVVRKFGDDFLAQLIGAPGIRHKIEFVNKAERHLTIHQWIVEKNGRPLFELRTNPKNTIAVQAITYDAGGNRHIEEYSLRYDRSCGYGRRSDVPPPSHRPTFSLSLYDVGSADDAQKAYRRLLTLELSSEVDIAVLHQLLEAISEAKIAESVTLHDLKTRYTEYKMAVASAKGDKTVKSVQEALARLREEHVRIKTSVSPRGAAVTALQAGQKLNIFTSAAVVDQLGASAIQAAEKDIVENTPVSWLIPAIISPMSADVQRHLTSLYGSSRAQKEAAFTGHVAFYVQLFKRLTQISDLLGLSTAEGTEFASETVRASSSKLTLAEANPAIRLAMAKWIARRTGKNIDQKGLDNLFI